MIAPHSINLVGARGIVIVRWSNGSLPDQLTVRASEKRLHRFSALTNDGRLGVHLG